MKKIANSLGPKLLAIMAKWGSANRATLVQFLIRKQFLFKIQIKRGVNFMKNIAIICIWGSRGWLAQLGERPLLNPVI